MPHSTHYRSFRRQSSQPITSLVQKPLFLTNHLAGTSNTNITTTKWPTQKPKQQIMKETNIRKTKPNETKAWYSSRGPHTARTEWTLDSLKWNSDSNSNMLLLLQWFKEMPNPYNKLLSNYLDEISNTLTSCTACNKHSGNALITILMSVHNDTNQRLERTRTEPEAWNC